jgi:hypothetical protein
LIARKKIPFEEKMNLPESMQYVFCGIILRRYLEMGAKSTSVFFKGFVKEFHAIRANEFFQAFHFKNWCSSPWTA